MSYRIETRTAVGTWVPSNYFRTVAYETLHECLAAIAACRELWPCGSFRIVEYR